jgi:hypothetical protein
MRNAHLKRLATLSLALFMLAGLADDVFAEQRPSGSEMMRAEFCKGTYICDDDGSWAMAEMNARQPEQHAMSGSEMLRAERCKGDYVCDEDGSWATADTSDTRDPTHVAMVTPTK